MNVTMTTTTTVVVICVYVVDIGKQAKTILAYKIRW